MMRDWLQLSVGSKQQEQLWTQASTSSEKANWSSWAIRMEFEPISELRQFMGMVNQLGKFSQNLTDLTQPLRQLLSKKSTWLCMGSTARFSICKHKGRSGETNHTSPLQPASTNKSVCWCIILRLRSCVDAEMPIWVQTCGLCITIYDRHRKEVCWLRKKH